MTSSSLRLLAFAAPALFAIACGSGSSSSTGSGGSGGGTSSTTTASSTASTTGSTSTGMGMACTDTADKGIITNGVTIDGGTETVDDIVQGCATASSAQEPATKDCIKMQSGLSDACTTCYDDTVQCVLMNCLGQCAADPSSTACQMCRDQNCTPAFHTCSGL